MIKDTPTCEGVTARLRHESDLKQSELSVFQCNVLFAVVIARSTLIEPNSWADSYTITM